MLIAPEKPRLPGWVVMHVPHDALDIPSEVRDQFLLSDDALREELVRMTDHRTLELFVGPHDESRVVRAPVSRLVVDVERFANDADEPMAARGMGVVYEVTSHLAPLRRPLTDAERAALIERHYRPHHARLEAAVTDALERSGRCLVVDCHSFPSRALPYEQRAGSTAPRPDICIGTDPFHTDARLAEAFAAAFRAQGWRVEMNDPFAGALVPASRYRKDARVKAVMVEVNRALYLDEHTAEPLPAFDDIARQVRQCVGIAVGRAA